MMSFRTPGERTLNAIRGRVAAGYRAAQSLVRRSLTLSPRLSVLPSIPDRQTAGGARNTSTLLHRLFHWWPQ